MTYPEQALNKFWSSFGMPAFDESVTLVNKPFPYITYQVSTGDFDGGDVPLNASIWDTEAQGHGALKFLAEKAEEIRVKIGRGGILLPYDDGIIWLKRGTPFAQTLGGLDNPQIKRKLLLTFAEFIIKE